MAQQISCSEIGILLVDDEASFRTSLAEILRDDGHIVSDYGAPAEIPPLPGLINVSILVTDYEMPGKTGLALADEFHAHHPDIPVILVTAYQTSALEAQFHERPYLRVVAKPVDYESIHLVIHETAEGVV